MNVLARYLMTTMAAFQCAVALPQESADQSLLWKIQSADGAVSHLFGTIHLADSTVFRQRDTVLRLVDTARDFYGELDLDSAASPLLAMKMMMPAGKSLADLYTPEEFKEIKEALEERLGPMSVMALRLKPAAVIGLLMMDGSEATAPMSIDHFLWERASTSGAARHGIERMDEQLAVLDSMPPKYLLEAIREQDSEDTLLEELVSAYAREDVNLIAQMIDSLSAAETFMQQLNDDRNAVMVERLTSPLQQGGLFIAVGAAHLPGDKGLVATLKRAGFVVTPVRGGKRVQWLTWERGSD